MDRDAVRGTQPRACYPNPPKPSTSPLKSAEPLKCKDLAHGGPQESQEGVRQLHSNGHVDFASLNKPIRPTRHETFSQVVNLDTHIQMRLLT
jgi:hypothetical protein